LDPFPLLQRAALIISREGFSVFYHKVKKKLKQYLWRFMYVDHSLTTYPSGIDPSKTYVRLREFKMKADKEIIRKKLRAIIEEIEKK
jgi:hypothetical protein